MLSDAAASKRTAIPAGHNYLYVLAGGLAQVVGYRGGADGSLTQVTTATVATGSVGMCTS